MPSAASKVHQHTALLKLDVYSVELTVWPEANLPLLFKREESQARILVAGHE